MNILAKIAIGAGIVVGASILWHLYVGGGIVANGRMESKEGLVYRWQVRRLGTDYVALTFWPNGTSENHGVFDTQGEAQDYVQSYLADRIQNPTIGNTPERGPIGTPQTVPIGEPTPIIDTIKKVTTTGTPVSAGLTAGTMPLA